jgi:hypothetical protein
MCSSVALKGAPNPSFQLTNNVRRFQPAARLPSISFAQLSFSGVVRS